MGIAIVPARHRFLACCQLALLLSLVPCGLGLAGEPEANAYRPPKDIAIPRPKPVEAPSAGLIAVLTDGEAVFQGRQGDTVEGRYRILRVAAERVEIELLPAGGREVLALEGL